MTGRLSDAQQRLVLEHSPRLVRSLVGRYGRKYEGLLSRQDIEQLARLGIAQAARGYDPDLGPFHVFAWKRAAGSIVDAARDETRHKGMRDALASAMVLARRAGEVLTDTPESVRAELSEHAAAAAAAMVIATVTRSDSAEDELMRAQRLAALGRCLDALEGEQRRMIELYYIERMKFADVAQALGLTFITARRRHKAALDALGRLLCDHAPSAVA